MSRILILLSCLIFSSCSALNAKRESLEVVDYVDLDRYLGRWYEMSRFDNSFQRGCTATQANYSLRQDGDLRVRNTCRKGSPKGPLKEAVARGWIQDKRTNSKLKVQFFLTSIKLSAIAGDYWILKIDPDYKYVLIGGPKRDYLWILSRQKTMPKDIYQTYVAKAKSLGFNTSKLIRTIHQ